MELCAEHTCASAPALAAYLLLPHAGCCGPARMGPVWAGGRPVLSLLGKTDASFTHRILLRELHLWRAEPHYNQMLPKTGH